MSEPQDDTAEKLWDAALWFCFDPRQLEKRAARIRVGVRTAPADIGYLVCDCQRVLPPLEHGIFKTTAASSARSKLRSPPRSQKSFDAMTRTLNALRSFTKMNPDKMNELMKSPVLEQALKELVEAWEGSGQLPGGHERVSRRARVYGKST